MAMCGKCNRALPANGNCLYCGKLEADGAYRKPSRGLGPWIGYFIKLGLAVALCGGAYWLLFTKAGQKFREDLHAKFGSSEDDDASPWVKPLKKYPKVKELLANRLSTKVTEEPIDASWKMVTLTRSTPDVMNWSFKVNKDTGEVQGVNFEGKSILLEK